MSVIIFVLFSILHFINGCPPKESIYPCECTPLPDNTIANIYCDRLTNDQDLSRVAKSLIGRTIRSFTIRYSYLRYLPTEVFKGMKIHKLGIINSTLMALSDTDVALIGQEDHMTGFDALRTNFLHDIDWSSLRLLNKLRLFSFVEGSISSIEGMEEMQLNKMLSIKFDQQKINHINEKAFSRATMMSELSLNKNLITKMKRTMLPNPADQLLIILLSDNKIQKFPVDMFTNMPNLRILEIKNNEILQLDENTFSPIWNSVHTLKALGNELQCDCRLSWILERRMPQLVQGQCTYPGQLKGKQLMQLKKQDLFCY